MLTAVRGATEVWMVGDNVSADIAGAEAVGLPAVLVRGMDPRAVRCCRTLAELPAVLSKSEMAQAITPTLR